MRFKDGVRQRGAQTTIVLAIYATDRVYSDFGERLVVTSITDALHMKDSLHHCGDAFDCRLPQNADPSHVADAIRDALGGNYDVVLEETHIHIEYDPR